MTRIFAVTGATGHVGGRVAQQLLAAGHQVRAVVRDDKSKASLALKEKGAELWIASYDDVAALTAAFTGVEAAFLMIPPGFTETDPDGAAFLQVLHLKEAVVTSGVKRIVLLSSVGAHHAHGTGVIVKLHYLEREFRTLAPKVAVGFLRPGYFAENTLGLMPVALSQGILPTMVDLDLKIPITTTQDIGDQAAKMLQEDFHSVRIVELEGPERVSYGDVAKIISDITGKPVQPVPVPEEKWAPTFEGFGFTKACAKQMADLVKGMNQGVVAYEGHHENAKGSITYKGFATTAIAEQKKAEEAKKN